MQTLLIAVSVISAIAAAAMCAIVIRMLREERRRSDARIEALVALADGPAGERGAEPGPASESRSAAAAAVYMRPERAFREEPGDTLRTRPLFATELEGGTGERTGDPETSGERNGAPLFLPPVTPSPWGPRLAVAAALVAIAAVAAFALGSGDRGGGAVPDTEESVALAPIELLALTHAIEKGALTITGLVQNPRGGRAHTDVRAVAYLLDEGGQTVATGTAPLDFRRLEPGVESPFVVTMAMADRVTRYRVGFRDGAGGVIAHVDRRQTGRIARRD